MSFYKLLEKGVELMQKLFFSLRLSRKFHFVKIDLICLLKQSRHLKQIFDYFQLHPLFLEVTNS